MELTAVAKRVSIVQQFASADGAERSLSGIRRSSATGGVLMYSLRAVPGLASAIWSESVIGGVRYWRFHCMTLIYKFGMTLHSMIVWHMLACTSAYVVVIGTSVWQA